MKLFNKKSFPQPYAGSSFSIGVGTPFIPGVLITGFEGHARIGYTNVHSFF